METKGCKVIIRKADVDDIKDIVEIEKLSFENPWSELSFLNEMVNERIKFYVAEFENRVVGFVIYWMIEDEAHIANIAVHPEKRGMGIGKKLLEKVINDSRNKNVRCINLEVNERNEIAKSLYFKYGFEVVGVREKYYNNQDDALLLTKKIER